MQLPWRSSGLHLTRVAVLLLVCSSVLQTSASSHHHHEGCGMHHPAVVQQHAVLRRRLQQLRAATANAATNPAAAGGSAAVNTVLTHTAGNDTSAGTTAATNHNATVPGQDTDDSLRRPVKGAAKKKQAAAASSNKLAGRSKTPIAAPLRINPVYQLSGLSAADVKRVKQQLVPAAFKVLQKYIKVVHPAGGVLKVDAFFGDGQQGCLISKVDASLAQGNPGAKDTDLVMYITSNNNSCLPGMIAMATACDVDPVTQRPILGSMNICAGALKGLAGLKVGSDAEQTAVGRVVEVLVHETVHVLGFGATHYEDWRSPEGKVFGQNNVVRNIGGRPYLVTPKVTAVARQYFACDKLPGAPLENEGPSFSATSHFEYRLLQRELMGAARPIDRSRTRFSAFTLAALEDTGWYKADYTHAEPLDWGRAAGCDFVLGTCWDYMTKHKQQPYYCGKGTLNQTRCTAEAAGWGVCRMNAFSDGCLLVGKYSPDAAAAVSTALPASKEDGRQAACYSPPQLQALQKGGPKGSLLPLLGGSYGAQRTDICYNLVNPPSVQKADDVIWVDGHGQIPEDVGKKPAHGPPPVAGAGARAPTAAARQSYQQRPGLPYMDGGNAQMASNVAACVSLRTSDDSDTTALGSNNWYGVGRRLLTYMTAVIHSSSSSSSSSRQLASAAGVMTAEGLDNTLNSQASTAAKSIDRSQSSNTATAIHSTDASQRATCINSPILCFKSTCDNKGQLWISAQQSNSRSSKFMCVSGKTVDLSKQLPGRYLLGYLQCPSNALVCETMGCGECSVSGGYCSRGKCYCHMERFGPGCKSTLVPALR